MPQDLHAPSRFRPPARLRREQRLSILAAIPNRVPWFNRTGRNAHKRCFGGPYGVIGRLPTTDTEHPDMALSEANLQAQTTWNNRACGTLSASENLAAGTLETFDRMAQRRYQRDDPWVPLVLDFPSMKGKEVLEIGHGQGCDLLHAAMAGANVHGIDLTPNHHEICKRYFAAKNLPVDLHLGNAGDLPFASESMDIVYSLGVLHHTDNTVRCISEAYRVLCQWLESFIHSADA